MNTANIHLLGGQLFMSTCKSIVQWNLVHCYHAIYVKNNLRGKWLLFNIKKFTMKHTMYSNPEKNVLLQHEILSNNQTVNIQLPPKIVWWNREINMCGIHDFMRRFTPAIWPTAVIESRESHTRLCSASAEGNWLVWAVLFSYGIIVWPLGLCDNEKIPV